MQTFDIVKKSEIEKTFRVQRVIGDFDIDIEHLSENFRGGVEMPDNWKIGVIVGTSGTGKSTIAKELFGDNLYTTPEYAHKSVIDDMPKESTVDQIEKMFYTVGFGSVPSWLKPYSVLSNGEKMRVDLARAFLERDFIVFDEFTSVVDRNVAKTCSIALSNAIKKMDKKFIAVTCHYDILEWLQPDWVLDTNTMNSFFMTAHDPKSISRLGRVGEKNGKSLGSIII